MHLQSIVASWKPLVKRVLQESKRNRGSSSFYIICNKFDNADLGLVRYNMVISCRRYHYEASNFRSISRTNRKMH